MAASATEQSIVRKLSKLNGTGAGGSLSEDVDEEGSGGGSKGLVLKDHKMAAAATGSVSSSSSSSASSHAKPASKKSKKTSTRTVESSSQQASASTSTRHNNHHSFNSRLRNMLEIFRCRLNSTSSAAAARRRSSSQATSTAAAVNNNSSNNNNKQQRQSTVSSSNNPPLIAASTPTSGEGGGAHHFSSSDSCKKNNSSTCCQLCINECAETDAANDGTPYMYSISTCDHAFCVNCLRLYLKYQIVESRVSISCPQCSEKMHPNDIYTLLSVPVRHMNSSINSSVADSTTPPDTVTEVRAPTTILTRTKEEAAEQQRQWAQLVDKYEEFMLRRVLVAIPDIRFCPAPDCTYAVIASGCANCPQLNCQRDGCNTSFCYHCKQYWHPNLTCEDAAFQNAQSTLSAVGGLIAVGGGATSASGGGQFSKFNSSSNIIRSFLQRSNSHISITSLSGATTINGVSGAGGGASSAGGGARNQTTALIAGGNSGLDSLIKDEIKRCPKCAALIVKMDDGSCNHITCAVCGCEFCWLCMKEISDLHYLSPSGCTFWGKKPWSRKKKILWQLGTLIGAPVGIALVAGVAVPAIIIGLPIWAGRKVYVRYKSIGKHKRNLIVFGTVVGTVIVAPFVAALAVGIGVPILLAYVYGVVPISLCRGSGGCGVTTNNNGGVRFAFDDETDNVNFFQNSNASTGASTSKTPAKIEKATASTTAKASSNTATAVTVSSSSNTGGGNTQVTIPISAIETRPADSSIIMSTVSSSSNDTATASSSNLASTALLTGGAAAPTGSHKKSVSISTTATSATPVLVTITMAKKSNMMSAAIANRGAHSHSDRKHKRRRAKQSSNRPSSKTSSSNRKMLKNRLAACDASAQMTAMASVTIASVACGSVDPESANPDAAGGSGTSADIAGNVMTHLNNKLTSSLNIPPAVPRSSPPNDTMSSSSLSASSSHLLLHHHSKDAPNSPAATVDPVPLSTDQVQSASVNSASSLNKLCKISTDADTVSSVAAAVVKRSKQSDRKAANSSVAVQKARLNNNPSIGETSIGAYTTSMSASETNLGDIDLPLTSTGQQQRREAENDHDDDEEEDDESTSDDSDSESESEDSEDDSADETDDSDSDSESDQDGDGHVGGPTKYEADRDSASNRAIAGGSLCKESGAGLETCSVSLSLKTEDQKSAKLGETETAVTGKYNSSSNNQDTKSAITTSSYATGNFQPGGGGVVVDSVSMKSDTRSINPSVTALAGSIKDNQSVENLSSSNL